MAKKNNNYFELIKEQSSYCLKASTLLEEIFKSFDYGKVNEYREKMHEIEHNADGVHHDILNRLSTEFITPIDQEDILRLVQIIDDITDAIDEVILDVYMYGISELPEKVTDMSHLLNKCVAAMCEAAAELKNFKKPETLRTRLVKVNDIEGEADGIYTEAVKELFASSTDFKNLLGDKAVYESMEECCDLCEHAADVIEQVIIKNT